MSEPTKAMVEAVARAICKSRTCEGLNCCQWPAQTARLASCPVDRGAYDDAANAAVRALTAAAKEGWQHGVPEGWRPKSVHWLGDREAAEESCHATDVRGCVLYFERQSDCLQFMRMLAVPAPATSRDLSPDEARRVPPKS